MGLRADWLKGGLRLRLFRRSGRQEKVWLLQGTCPEGTAARLC